MESTFKMPIVAECAARECAYNADDRCQARAITIGDGLHPACDTFLRSSVRSEEGAATASVGACKVSSCAHNRRLECEAASIHVGYHGDHPDCLTFARR